MGGRQKTNRFSNASRVTGLTAATLTLGMFLAVGMARLGEKPTTPVPPAPSQQLPPSSVLPPPGARRRRHLKKITFVLAFG